MPPKLQFSKCSQGCACVKPEVNSDDTEHKCSPLLTFFTAVYVYMFTNTLKLNGGYFHE